MTVRQINSVYNHERDTETGRVIPHIEEPLYDAATAHDSTVMQVMRDRKVSQDAAERLVYEDQQVMLLRAQLNSQQRMDVQAGPDGVDRPVHLSGPTNEEIDAQADALKRRLVASRG